MSITSFLLHCSINESLVELQVPPTKKLVDILRDDLHLIGTKIACEMGRCGACMVLLNDKPVNSCLLMAYQCSGKKIMTIEGLSCKELDPIQKAFLEEGGFQCGYCTPGMIIAVKGLLHENPFPNRNEIEEGLSGNLCRCTGYGPIVRAVDQVVKEWLTSQENNGRNEGIEIQTEKGDQS